MISNLLKLFRQNYFFIPNKRLLFYLWLMPLLKEWTKDTFDKYAIWKIEESESFFAEKTGLNPQISSERKKLEHLAGRFLLKHLEPQFPLDLIQKDDHDKPRLPKNELRFSISHSFPYVAVTLSPHKECGIDIQIWHPRMLSLQKKFLSVEEQDFFANDPKLVTLAWCIKEAAYKWQGMRGVEFIEHMPIHSFDELTNEAEINMILCNQKIKTSGIISENFAFSHVI